MATLCGCSRFRELMGLLNEIKDLQQRLQQQTGQSGLNSNLTNDAYFFIERDNVLPPVKQAGTGH
jgi:hypothetical protein